ncbi:transposase domain-containing protein [Actinomadura chokoriensis]|uniref:Transposase domain-containing protein n=1 Tax=Actinomadura chokoriensis TaxID=454156 RepID=A0ABV4QUV3_9ACTN
MVSAISVVTRQVATAAGVFAPGHLGELTRLLPFELVDAVLAETGAVERRLRNLPSRVGVYFVLALGLFPDLGYARVWDKLVAGWSGDAPSVKALPSAMTFWPQSAALQRRRAGAPRR